MSDEEYTQLVDKLTTKYPTAMPYFFTQDPDYITVKERGNSDRRDRGGDAEGCRVPFASFTGTIGVIFRK